MYKIGDNVPIISYKHDGNLHRIWNTGKLILNNEKMVVLANDKTQVLESDGKTWFTKEPAICIFPKKSWYNVIVMIKQTGVSYYSNLASPFILDTEGLKYIDYDLDVKSKKDKSFNILDKNEYSTNTLKYNYPLEIRQVLEYEFNKLYEIAKNREFPFDDQTVYDLFELYKSVKSEINDNI